jgi:hypothetical protein
VLSVTLLLLSLAQVGASSILEPVSDSLEGNILRRFDSLPLEERERIAKELVPFVLGKEHPLCETALALLDDRRLRNASIDPKGALLSYSPKEYAPALKLKTKHVKVQTKAWERFRKRYLHSVTPNRYATWAWDYSNNQFLAETSAKPRETVIAMLAGRWPDSGKFSAFAEGSLDFERDFDPIAYYFEHVYRDRNGKVYDEIRLYDMWGSQVEFGISDVESIAFLRNIEDSDRLESPIAASEHDGIYEKIEARFTAYREYRDLHHALAQRMVDPSGLVPRLYGEVAPALDQAWILMGHSSRRMATFLKQYPTRKEFLAAVAKRVPKTEESLSKESWAKHQEARNTLPGLIRAFTLDFLSDEGLTGFHRR